MKFLTSAASVLLMANVTFGANLAARKQAARETIRARNALRRSAAFKGTSDVTIINGTAAQESSNWAGAAITGSGITEVSGTFTVPKPTVPSGGSSSTEYCGAAWVGIDGYSNSDLIQTGVLWCIEDGSYDYEACKPNSHLTKLHFLCYIYGLERCREPKKLVPQNVGSWLLR